MLIIPVVLCECELVTFKRALSKYVLICCLAYTVVKTRPKTKKSSHTAVVALNALVNHSAI